MSESARPGASFAPGDLVVLAVAPPKPNPVPIGRVMVRLTREGIGYTTVTYWVMFNQNYEYPPPSSGLLEYQESELRPSPTAATDTAAA